MKHVLERDTIRETEYFPEIFTCDNHEVPSICITCIHADNCVYREKGNGSIISCDEFESPRGDSEDSALKNRLPPQDKRVGRHKEEHKGLCANCDNRHTCQYADTETGIWFCEEYK